MESLGAGDLLLALKVQRSGVMGDHGYSEIELCGGSAGGWGKDQPENDGGGGPRV